MKNQSPHKVDKDKIPGPNNLKFDFSSSPGLKVFLII